MTAPVSTGPRPEPRYLDLAYNQEVSEIESFAKLLRSENATRYLEIGSRFGASFWKVGTTITPGSLMVSVDKPVDPGGAVSLAKCVAELQKNYQHQTQWIDGDSRSSDTIEKVRRASDAGTDGWRFDAVLIDADHKLESVVLDWINYGPLARIVALHDIGWAPKVGMKPHKRMDVPDVWNILKSRCEWKNWRAVEYIKQPGFNGIGVLIR